MVLVPQAAKSLQEEEPAEAAAAQQKCLGEQPAVEAKSLLEAAQPLLAQLLDERPAHARSGRYLPENCTGPSSSAGRGTP